MQASHINYAYMGIILSREFFFPCASTRFSCKPYSNDSGLSPLSPTSPEVFMSSLKCLVVVVSSLLIGTASISASAATVIHACYMKTTGAVRIVPAVSDCHPNEQAVSWNEEGPAGPAGPAGAPGATTVPANLAALSAALSTNGGVSSTGATRMKYIGTCMIGDIILSVNGYGAGALPADGRLLPINQYVAVFSILGTNFGGNGTTNFALPDLRKFAPQGLQYSICVQGIFPPSL